jgi:hypothetical protein
LNKLPQKIISGGQTGVDQGALSAALKIGIDCGGWCPPGRLCEDGVIPKHFPLIETPVERSIDAPDVPRSLRTEWNVRDADASLILVPKNLLIVKGTEWTIQRCIHYKKPYLVTDPFEDNAADEINSWLLNISIRVLNVAGPSEKTVPGIARQVDRLVTKVFTG